MDIRIDNDPFERVAVALERIATVLESTKLSEPRCSAIASTELAGDVVPPNEVPQQKLVEAGSVVTEFLATRGIKIKTIKLPDAVDGVIDSLSLFLGERYSGLKGVLTKIKKNMQNGGAITESIGSLSQEDISSGREKGHRKRKGSHLKY